MMLYMDLEARAREREKEDAEQHVLGARAHFAARHGRHGRAVAERSHVSLGHGPELAVACSCESVLWHGTKHGEWDA